MVVTNHMPPTVRDKHFYDTLEEALRKGDNKFTLNGQTYITAFEEYHKALKEALSKGVKQFTLNGKTYVRVKDDAAITKFRRRHSRSRKRS